MQFQDKVVVITGGSSGIGRAAAVAFASEGAKVLIADVNDVSAAIFGCTIGCPNRLECLCRTNIVDTRVICATNKNLHDMVAM